jgi:hypothetical protein
MGIFYDREENEKKIIIKYTRRPIWYLVLIIAMINAFLIHFFVWETLIVFVIFVAVYFIDMLKPNGEIRKAMKKDKVTVSGSAYSFSNPLVFEIRKETGKGG